MMRLTHFIATNFVGGPERQILSHLERLQRSGEAEVALLSFAEPGGYELQERAEALGVPVQLLPVEKRRLGQALGQLAEHCRRWQPELICTHGYKALTLTLALRLNGRCPCVAFSRGWTEDSMRVRLYTLIDKTLVRFADRVVAVAESQRQRLLKVRVPAGRIRVINNACTLRPEEIEAPVEGDVRAELGLAPDTPLLLSAGRLSGEKGHRYLIEAMEHISEAEPRAHLLLAGDGPLRGELEALARSGAAADRIHFLGFRRDVKDLFRQTDLFVLPSLSEGLPNVVLEAMALGAPVVATAVGGVPEVLEDGRTGLLVPAQDSKRLAEASAGLLREPERAAALARRAREAVYRRYSADRQTELLLEVYKEVTECGPRIARA